MKILPLQFTKKGWDHVQTKRVGNLAIYRRSKPTSPAPHFELIRIRQGKPYQLAGIDFPATELYPSETQWGQQGWTHKTEPEAESHMASLCMKG